MHKLASFVFPSHRGNVNSMRASQLPFELILPAVLTCFCFASLLYFDGEGGRLLYGIIFFLLGTRFSVIGLTGSMGAGKTTASSYMKRKLGFIVIDADLIARKVVESGTPAFKEIVKYFGNAVVDKNTGQLDRMALGRIVFTDTSKRLILQSITHPRIIRTILVEILINKLKGKTVVLDAPLLFESPGLSLLCHQCILIDVSPEIQVERLIMRNPELTRKEIQDRLSSQLSREKKRHMADYIFNNDADRERLYKQIDAFFGSPNAACCYS